jgi:hypothetical protein
MITASAAAQNYKPDSSESQHQKALLFSINEFRLDSFNGGIGFKYWISDGFAQIVTINGSYSKTEREQTETLTGNTDKNVGYGASMGIEKHWAITKDISPYVGASIGVAYEDKNEKVNSANYLGALYTNERITSSTSVSLNISFGVEVFLAEHISLAGQYNLGAVHKSGEEEYKTPYSATKMKISELTVRISSGGLILAVYF